MNNLYSFDYQICWKLAQILVHCSFVSPINLLPLAECRLEDGFVLVLMLYPVFDMFFIITV